ncbi:MAG: YHS domain-containing protein [Candidatus Scalindua sp.]
MKKFLTIALVFIFLLGLSITYTKRLAQAGEGGKVVDRVCTMQIDKDSAKTLKNEGYTYYFCSDHCKATFAKSPAKYACICPQLHEGCDCGHCTGKGVPCICAEAHAESHTGEHEHEHEHEGGEHHHS